MNRNGRSMRSFLPFLVAVLELAALVFVSGQIGFGWALLLLLSTSVIGVALLRFEGFRAWASLREAVADGTLGDDADGETGEAGAGRATTKIADTGVRMLAGVLLILPGFVTDVFALLLLIPPVRRSAGRRMAAAAFRTFPGRGAGLGGRSGTGLGGGPQATRHEPVVIEGEVVDPEGESR